MEDDRGHGAMIARCIVCKGNIHEREIYEVWEGGFYCSKHSLPQLRARARDYARMLEAEVTPTRER